MRVSKFRSLWGIDAGSNLSNWEEYLPTLGKLGYDGIEVDTANLNSESDYRLLRKLCDKLDLAIIPLVFSSWPQYVGPRPKELDMAYHLRFYREQLELAALLHPVCINAHTGADHWTWDESVQFYQAILETDAELGFSNMVYHETHRNRSLSSPYATDYILQRVPRLRLTADLSHWVVSCERLLGDGEEDQALIQRVIPHIYHIHARIGTTQSSQCPEPLNPVFAEERSFFEQTWLQVLEQRFKEGGEDASITFVPEYGPFPYHPISSAKDYSTVADEEGKRLQMLFKTHAGEVTSAAPAA